MNNDESFPLSETLGPKKKNFDESVEATDKSGLEYLIQDVDCDTVHLVIPRKKAKKNNFVSNQKENAFVTR